MLRCTFWRKGESIDQMPLDVGIGPARVIAIENPGAVTAEELRGYEVRAGERILFRTRNSDVGYAGEFRKDFVYVAADAAQLLADAQVSLVGIDYMSIGGFYTDGEETHNILLKAGVWVVENLVLGDVDAGEYEMVCLPLKIAGGDGVLCWVVVLWRVDEYD